MWGRAPCAPAQGLLPSALQLSGTSSALRGALGSTGKHVVQLASPRRVVLTAEWGRFRRRARTADVLKRSCLYSHSSKSENTSPHPSTKNHPYSYIFTFTCNPFNTPTYIHVTERMRRASRRGDGLAQLQKRELHTIASCILA